MHRRSVLHVLMVLALLAARVPAQTDGGIDTDAPAALLVFPYIAVDTAAGRGTILQLTNTSNAPLSIRCFYVSSSAPPGSVTDFSVRLTAKQPIGWSAALGLQQLPLGDRLGDTAAAGLIPPVPTDPFEGSLRCIAIDEQAVPVPVDRNAMVGQATIQSRLAGSPPLLDASTYRAIGLQALGTGNGDGVLSLGGPNPEYSACPRRVSLAHFTDGALLPAVGDGAPVEVSTILVVVPCRFALSDPGAVRTRLTLTEFNEFEQRTGTNTAVVSQQVSPLGLIGTTEPERSIFHSSTQGTLTAKLIIEPVADDSGVLAFGFTIYHSSPLARTSVVPMHFSGAVDVEDLLLLPGAVPPSPVPPTPTPVFTAVPTASFTASPLPTTTTPASPAATPTNAVPASTPTSTLSMVPQQSSGGCSIDAERSRPSPYLWLLLAGLLLVRWARDAGRRRPSSSNPARWPTKTTMVFAVLTILGVLTAGCGASHCEMAQIGSQS